MERVFFKDFSLAERKHGAPSRTNGDETDSISAVFTTWKAAPAGKGGMVHHAMLVMLNAIDSALWNSFSWPELLLLHWAPGTYTSGVLMDAARASDGCLLVGLWIHRLPKDPLPASIFADGFMYPCPQLFLHS
jgi:hypothetical protein